MILISKITLAIATLSLISMVLGHFGIHELNFITTQISTYAAKAPYDYFITASILLSSLTLLLISFLNSKYQLFPSSYLSNFIPALSGAASFGLIMLSYFEEKANNLSALKQAGFSAIRIQTFHDAGLLIFFNCSLLLSLLTGSLIVIYSYNKTHKALGVFILSMTPMSYMLMTTQWPKALGIEGLTVGLSQRAALLCLWLAFTLFLIMASNKAFKPTPKSAV